MRKDYMTPDDRLKNFSKNNFLWEGAYACTVIIAILSIGYSLIGYIN